MTRLKSQLEENFLYTQMQRLGESNPAYRTSYLYDVGSMDAPTYTIIIDVFEDEGSSRGSTAYSSTTFGAH